MIKITDSPIQPKKAMALVLSPLPRFTVSPAPRIPAAPSHQFPASPFHRFSGSKKAGFSLLEVMVAIVIMSFGILAILQLFPLGLKAGRISQDVTIATFLAQQRMEELKNTRYIDIEDKSGVFAAPYVEFNWNQIVSEETVNGETDMLKKVTVRVSWNRYGKTRNVTLVTFLANYRKILPL